ncbi:MAG: hypothetical protein EXX96DRAFT_613952 [Benjaminiella poitrasii]|nr:MAG: hypothetical protein EXX96DRAFT_613952 [Benjaminiella poitrasii]
MLFNSLLSIHYNYCSSNKQSIRTRRKSSPALPIIHRRQERPKLMKKLTAATTEDIIRHRKLLDARLVNDKRFELPLLQNVSEEDDEEEDSFDDEFDDMETRCACGVVLTKGWACDDCRMNCSDCNRAYVKGDYCTRCNKECEAHGAYRLAESQECPKCE